MQHHRKSLAKRGRRHGFRIRQRSAKGRAIHNRKRRVGRCCNVKRSFS